MPYYTMLKAEIAKPEYDGLDDEQIAAALNTANVPIWVDVPVGTIIGYFALTGILYALETFDAAPPPSAPVELRASVRALLRLTLSPHVTTFQTSNPTTRAALQASLAAQVSAGLMTAEQQTATLAFAQSTTSRAAQLGLGTVGPGDVAVARSA
jgi:hypothetical protein